MLRIFLLICCFVGLLCHVNVTPFRLLQRELRCLLQISHTTSSSFSVFLSPRTTSHYSNWSVCYGLCVLTPYVFKHFAGELQALSLSSCSIKPSYLSSYFASESPFGTLLLNLCPGLEPRPCSFESHQSLSRLFVTSSLWLNNYLRTCGCHQSCRGGVNHYCAFVVHG